jgi:hypothetical protein
MFFNYCVYVACSLTHASEEFKQQVELLKDSLRKVCRVLCFLGISDDTAHAIYEHDIHNCVYRSDLVVAITDFPSTGLGYEIGTQVEARRMPVLAVAHIDSKVTKLILDPQQPGYEFHRYRNFHEEVFNLVLAKLEKMHQQGIGDLPLFPGLHESLAA